MDGLTTETGEFLARELSVFALALFLMAEKLVAILLRVRRPAATALPPSPCGPSLAGISSKVQHLEVTVRDSNQVLHRLEKLHLDPNSPFATVGHDSQFRTLRKSLDEAHDDLRELAIAVRDLNN